MNIKKPSAHLVGHIAIFSVVGAVMIVNAVLLAQMNGKVKTERKAAEEAARPVELQLVKINDSNCAACFNTENIVASIKNVPGLAVTAEENLEYTSDQGAELLKKYAVDRVPALLLRGELDRAFEKVPALATLGTRESDGTLVVANIPPPYVEVASGQVKGSFTVTYLTDVSCTECYDVKSHRNALAGLAMAPSEEKTLDVKDAAGRTLVAKYNIASVPTILLTGDLGEYAQLAQVWPQVGTTEQDGTYVFRAGQALMGVYKDLKTGKVVTPEPLAQAPTTAPTQ
ncbi:hypothetical protein HY477_02045 [Candidatus Uhrbacteria bacterium]|nr:hypothetical protein [Candidatus Uhrbacteria bacterium]